MAEVVPEAPAPSVDRYRRVEARDLMASVPGGRGYDDRLCTAIEGALNNEWHRGAQAEREKIAGWLECPRYCLHLTSDDHCNRIDAFCARIVADCIRRGTKP